MRNEISDEERLITLYTTFSLSYIIGVRNDNVSFVLVRVNASFFSPNDYAKTLTQAR